MHFWNDLVFACRGLRKSPGLVAVVTLSLGLGIGVNTTLFNLFNQIVLAKPTAVAPERLPERVEPAAERLLLMRDDTDRRHDAIPSGGSDRLSSAGSDPRASDEATALRVARSAATSAAQPSSTLPSTSVR